MRTTLSMHHIARIEGHGNISLSIEDGRVTDVKMNVVEPARLFESMVAGRPFTQASYIASRICGICSSSHVVTDLLAIESALGVKTSERTRVCASFWYTEVSCKTMLRTCSFSPLPISRATTACFPLPKATLSCSAEGWASRLWATSCAR